MKDYNREITYKTLNDFVDLAVNEGLDVKVVEGGLNDTYVIHNTLKELTIEGVKAREYVVLYPKFQTSWSNSFHILMTDDESKAEEFIEVEEV